MQNTKRSYAGYGWESDPNPRRSTPAGFMSPPAGWEKHGGPNPHRHPPPCSASSLQGPNGNGAAGAAAGAYRNGHPDAEAAGGVTNPNMVCRESGVPHTPFAVDPVESDCQVSFTHREEPVCQISSTHQNESVFSDRKESVFGHGEESVFGHCEASVLGCLEASSCQSSVSESGSGSETEDSGPSRSRASGSSARCIRMLRATTGNNADSSNRSSTQKLQRQLRQLSSTEQVAHRVSEQQPAQQVQLSFGSVENGSLQLQQQAQVFCKPVQCGEQVPLSPVVCCLQVGFFFVGCPKVGLFHWFPKTT